MAVISCWKWAEVNEKGFVVEVSQEQRCSSTDILRATFQEIEV